MAIYRPTNQVPSYRQATATSTPANPMAPYAGLPQAGIAANRASMDRRFPQGGGGTQGPSGGIPGLTGPAAPQGPMTREQRMAQARANSMSGQYQQQPATDSAPYKPGSGDAQWGGGKPVMATSNPPMTADPYQGIGTGEGTAVEANIPSGQTDWQRQAEAGGFQQQNNAYNDTRRGGESGGRSMGSAPGRAALGIAQRLTPNAPGPVGSAVQRYADRGIGSAIAAGIGGNSRNNQRYRAVAKQQKEQDAIQNQMRQNVANGMTQEQALDAAGVRGDPRWDSAALKEYQANLPQRRSGNAPTRNSPAIQRFRGNREP